jgi:hypothetical protein
MRRRKELGRGRESRASKALLDYSVILHIPVCKKADDQQRDGKKADEGDPNNRITSEKPA